MLSLITIFSLLFAFIAFRKIEWAIFIIAAALPSYLIRFSIFGIPATLLEAMILILAVARFSPPLLRGGRAPEGGEGGLPTLKETIKTFKKNPFFWPIVAIFITATVSVFVSPNLHGALGSYKAYFLEPLILFIIVISTIKSRRGLAGLIWALGVSAAYLSVIAIWQKLSWLVPIFEPLGYVPQAFLKSDGAVDRAVSLFGYPNALGLYLGPIIILFTGFIFWDNKKFIFQFAKVFIIALSFLTIVLAKSEGAILAVLIVWLVWALIYKKTRLYALTIMIIFAIILLAQPIIFQKITEKITLQDYSGYVRRLIWNESGKMLADNWLFGAGLAGYQTKIAPYHLKTFEIFLYPHNIILNFWSELGILGLLSFVWLLINFFRLNITPLSLRRRGMGRGYNIIAATLIAIMAQIIIHGLVDAPYFKNDLSVLFWLIMAMVTVNNKKIMNNK